VDNVEVLGRKLIDGFTSSCLGNSCIGAKGEEELPSVAEDTAFGRGDYMLVIPKPTKTGQLMELLQGERCFRVGRIRGVARVDGWEARLRVMEVNLDFVLGHAFEFLGRALSIGDIHWSSRVVVLGIWHDDGDVFKRVDALNQLVAIEIPQASQESRWWDERYI
jgi:hypothetical protein